MSENACFDSIAACAAALGLDKSLLQSAKRDGAPGFRGSRVYPYGPDGVLLWLVKRNQQPGESKEEIEKSKLIDDREHRRWQHAREKGEYILKTDAINQVNRVCSVFIKGLDALPDTIAPDLVGRTSIAEIGDRIRARTDELKLQLHQGEWK